ncbi:MAG: hypothetical protein HC890_18165 [Chloroflexaceae bacterium]|nr:hypothetical protein [Chloroflexaceae bacterium]
MRESLEQEVAQLEKQISILQREGSLLTSQLNTANETATNLKAWTRDSQVAIAGLNEQLERWQSVIAALLGAMVVAGLAIAVMGGARCSWD